jgi:hypothetical protein
MATKSHLRDCREESLDRNGGLIGQNNEEYDQSMMCDLPNKRNQVQKEQLPIE